MNPELQRNFWLELSPTRLVMMPLVLGLIFIATWTSTDLAGDGTTQLAAIDWVARTLFFLIVVVWGTWVAARLVTGEIRGRTWDTQRMSAISPMAMVLGKLFGGTAFVWLGGLICLTVIVFHEVSTEGLGDGIQALLFWIATGLFAQLTAFFVSMIAVRRGAATSRLMSIFSLILGISAGWTVLQAWAATQSELFGVPLEGVDISIFWFGYEVKATTFQLINIGFSVFWTFLGCYVLMRHELQTRTGPWVWIAYIIYSMVFYAGYADAIANLGSMLPADASGKGGVPPGEVIAQLMTGETTLALRWAFATGAAIILTYGSLILAPKDWVQMRWVRDRFLHARIDQALLNLPAWGYAFIAAIIGVAGLFYYVTPVALPAIDATVQTTGLGTLPAAIDGRIIAITALFFLMRDIGIVLWFNAGKSAKRPDLGAFVTLVLLYMIVPMIVLGMQQSWLLPAFSLWHLEHNWMQPVWPFVEAVVVFLLVIVRRNGVRERSV